MTGGKIFQMGDRMQKGIKRGRSTYVKVFAQDGADKGRAVFCLWHAHNWFA
jgi:hypothetical protein